MAILELVPTGQVAPKERLSYWKDIMRLRCACLRSEAVCPGADLLAWEVLREGISSN